VVEDYRIGRNIISHVHFYGIGGRRGVQLKEKLEGAIGSLIKVVSLNCVAFDTAQKLIEEITHSSKGAEKGRAVVLLTKAEELGRFKMEALRYGFSLLNKKGVILVTMSEKPWSKIESSSFRMAISTPVQYFISWAGQEQGDSLVDILHARHTAVAANLIKYVVDTVDLHYNDLELLSHIVNWISAECVRMGIDPTATKNSDLNKLSSSLKEVAKRDAAFSLEWHETKAAEQLEYPILTKLVIMASYCASYNPASSDARFFSLKGGAQARKKRTLARKKHEDCQVTGAKSFDYKRLVLMYSHFWRTYEQSAQQEKMEEVDLFEQLRMLIADGIIATTSPPDNLDEPKFKCLCSLEFVEGICKSVDARLDIRRDYLLDFVSEE